MARTASSMGVIDADMVEERLINNERSFRRSIDILLLWELDCTSGYRVLQKVVIEP